MLLEIRNASRFFGAKAAVDRGQLDPGKRADLVVVHEASRRIEAVIAAGRLVWSTGEAGARIATRLPPTRLAAE